MLTPRFTTLVGSYDLTPYDLRALPLLDVRVEQSADLKTWAPEGKVRRRRGGGRRPASGRGSDEAHERA